METTGMIGSRRGATASHRLWAIIVVGAAVTLIMAVELFATSSVALGPRRLRGDSRTLFEADCAVCHGNTARGSSRGPSLVGFGVASLDYSLSTGRMPISSPAQTPKRRSPAYSASTIRSLITYVQSLTGPAGPPIPHVNLRGTDLGAGGESFRLQCAACHSWAGEGGALVNRAAPTTERATPTQIAEAIRTGPGAMPRFGTAALNDREVNDVVAYVRYLDNPVDRGGDALGRIGPLAEGAVALAVGLGLLTVISRWIGTRA